MYNPHFITIVFSKKTELRVATFLQNLRPHQIWSPYLPPGLCSESQLLLHSIVLHQTVQRSLPTEPSARIQTARRAKRRHQRPLTAKPPSFIFCCSCFCCQRACALTVAARTNYYSRAAARYAAAAATVQRGGADGDGLGTIKGRHRTLVSTL